MAQVRKKFINEPASAVRDALHGVVASDQTVAYHLTNPNIIQRKDIDEHKAKKVTLIGGGGSGHEPFAAGLVGINGLTAAVCGDIYASPSAANVYEALFAAGEQAAHGMIVFVINYTGDRLNFGLALERLRAHSPNGAYDLVHIDDDISIEEKSGATIGGRGLAGALLVLQLAGVLADQEKCDFEHVRTQARQLVENLATYSVSLYPCALPGRDSMFDLKADEMEIALGIHGEPGVSRSKVKPARQIVDIVLRRLTECKRLDLQKEQPLVVLINNLGAVSQLEMGIIRGEALDWLIHHGYTVRRLLVGAAMTSLDAHGFSISLLRLTDERWLKWMDTPSAISRHWRASTPLTTPVDVPKPRADDYLVEAEHVGVTVDKDMAATIEKVLRAACAKIIESEDRLNKLDAACGDGDCGTSMKTAAKAIISASDGGRFEFSRPATLCQQLSRLFEHAVGGTTGAIYALLFNGAAGAFASAFGTAAMRAGLAAGLGAVCTYSLAAPGHRTLVDPLDAAVRANANASWEEIVKNVEASAEATARIEAKSGRASYTSAAQQRDADAGAMAVALWFRAGLDCL